MKQKKREFLSMDLTPLIDVVFILLVFFIVAAQLKTEENALVLSLPSSSATASTEKKETTIELSSAQIAINAKIVSQAELKNALNTLEKDKPVSLRVDENVEYKRLVLVLDLLRSAELNNIELITKSHQ